MFLLKKLYIYLYNNSIYHDRENHCENLSVYRQVMNRVFGGPSYWIKY